MVGFDGLGVFANSRKDMKLTREMELVCRRKKVVGRAQLQEYGYGDDRIKRSWLMSIDISC
jgi:hypothetical protein